MKSRRPALAFQVNTPRGDPYAVAVRATTELLTSGTCNSVADGIAYDTMNDAITAAH